MATKIGEGIDRYGNPVIDPTKNVLDLVQAAIKRQDDLREAEAKFQNGMREAETRRINELASQKNGFDLAMANVLRGNLDEVKRDLQVELRSLNQFRWESGGSTGGRSQVISWVISAAAVIFAVAVYLLKH